MEEEVMEEMTVESAGHPSSAASPPPRLMPIITYSIPPPTTAATLCFVRELAAALKRPPTRSGSVTPSPKWISDVTRLLIEFEATLLKDGYDGDVSWMADDAEALFPVWQWVLAQDQGATTPEIRPQEGSPPTVQKLPPPAHIPADSWADLMQMVDRVLVLANRFDANGKQY